MACHNKFKAEILSGTNILLEPLQLPSKTHKSWWPLHSKVYFKGVNNPIFLPMKASMTWSYLCSAPGPFHGETIYILSSMESFSKYIVNIQAKNLFCDVGKKGNMLLCPKTGACVGRLSIEAATATCSRTPVSLKEQFERGGGIVSVQRCSSHVYMQGKSQGPTAVPELQAGLQCDTECKNLMKS